MTISYTLYLDTSLNAKEAAGILRRLRVQDADQLDPKETDEKAWVREGCVSIHLLEVGKMPAAPADEHGISARLAVIFDMITDDIDAATPLMLRHILGLLRNERGDAVFMNVGDDVLILRRKGKLQLALSQYFWSASPASAELLGMVTEPYTDLDGGKLSSGS